MDEIVLTDSIYNSNVTSVEKFELGSFVYVRKIVKPPFAEFKCSREVSVLERVKGLEGVQQIVEQDSPTSFISEYVPGTCLRHANKIPNDYFDKLSVILGSIHERGVADIDFAHSTDLIVGLDGNPTVIDLESSIVYDPNKCLSFLVKPFFDYVCELNRRYIVNRKARFLPEQLTPEERSTAEDIGALAKSWRLVRNYLDTKKSRFWHL